MEQHELDQIVARLTDLRDKFSHIADTTPTKTESSSTTEKRRAFSPPYYS